MFFVHIFPSVSSVKSVSGPMASTATFKFGLQISKSHGPTRGGGGGGGGGRGVLPHKVVFFTLSTVTALSRETAKRNTDSEIQGKTRKPKENKRKTKTNKGKPRETQGP